MRGLQQASAEVINVFRVARQPGFVAPDKETCLGTHECLEDGDAAARCMNSKAWINRATTMVLETTLEKARDAVDLMKDAVRCEASNQTQQLADGMRVVDFTVGQRPTTDARVLQSFKTTLATKEPNRAPTLACYGFLFVFCLPFPYAMTYGRGAD